VWLSFPGLVEKLMRHRSCATFVLALAATFTATGTYAGAYKVSSPIVQGNLAVYPVQGAPVSSAAPMTLDAAMARGLARIHEVAGGRHAIDNFSDRHIFIQAGSLVRGGSQDQVAAYSTLVPPGARSFGITMFCVERDRSAPLNGQPTDAFSAAGLIPPWQAAKLSLLSSAERTPTADLLRRIGIWLSVESLTGALSKNVGTTVRSTVSPSSLPRALEDLNVYNAQRPYVDALAGLADSVAGSTGVVVAINGVVRGAEVYASNELFREMWPALLRAFATQAVALQGMPQTPPPAAGDIDAFLGDAESGRNAATLTSVFRQPGGDWVHRSYVATVDGSVTGLEAAVLRALATGWSIDLPTVDLTGTRLRRYHEALILQALTARVADRDGAIGQAQRAGLPVDPDLILRLGRLMPSVLPPLSQPASWAWQDDHSRQDNSWMAVLMGLGMLVFLLRRQRRSMQKSPVVEPAAVYMGSAARCSQRRRPEDWTMSDWIGPAAAARQAAETSVPVVPCKQAPPDGSRTATKSRRRSEDLVPA
jgi:hypothetical protein